MVKIIETNISLGNRDNEMIDFQSRVIEAESWEVYVEELQDRKSISRNACIGNMYGITLPREVEMIDEKYDDFHLTLTFYNPLGWKMKRLAFLIRE